MDRDYEGTLYTCYRKCESTLKQCEASGIDKEECMDGKNTCVITCDRNKGWDGRFWS
jgi:hypothetical protein